MDLKKCPALPKCPGPDADPSGNSKFLKKTSQLGGNVPTWYPSEHLMGDFSQLSSRLPVANP